MGFLGDVFGRKGDPEAAPRGVYLACDACGGPIQVPGPPPRVTSFSKDDVSWDGVAGYCRSCRRYLCSAHLEVRQVGDSFGIPVWEAGCVSCGVTVSGGP